MAKIRQISWMKLLGITLPFLITSCATMAPEAPEVKKPWVERQPTLNQIETWQLSGKVAVQMGNNAGSASINWRQNYNNYTISLLGPMGAGAMKLTGKPGSVVMETADGKRYTASTPEELLSKHWGYRLPVSNIKYWARGLYVPNASVSNTHFDASGRLNRFTQQGWTVQYLNFTRSGKADLPSNIVVTTSGVKVKMIVYSWNIGK